jgi:phenylacetate-CoA ligase
LARSRSRVDGRRRAREEVARGFWRARWPDAGRLYAQLRESERWSQQDLRALQVDLLRNLLRAAASNRFYRDRLNSAGLAPEDVASLVDIRVLPPLEREELQREGFGGLGIPGRKGRRASSSGSTGRPVTTVCPPEMSTWLAASSRRFDDWLGIRLGERRLQVLTGLLPTSRPERIGRALLNVAPVPSYRLADPGFAEQFAESVLRRPPALVFGEPGGTYALARTLTDRGKRLATKACWWSGNHLPEQQREVIELAFGCRVRERYGAWEVGAIAHECPEEGALHVPAEGVLVEIVRPDGRPAAPGEIGHVVVTQLHNLAMPLIRYRIGDLAEAPLNAECRCGRGLPVFGRLIGRSNELVHTASGGFVSPEAVCRIITRSRESILEFQVVQAADLALEVRLVQRNSPAPEAYREQIAEGLDRLIGLPGTTKVERVSSLPRTPAGKLRHVVSHAHGPEGRGA